MFSYVKRSVIFIFLTISLFADVDFTYPTTVTGDSIPNLSPDAYSVQYYSAIATDSETGQYVYSIWASTAGTGVVRSTDYGDNWVNPTSAPGGTPLLTNGGDNYSLIVTSSTGQYVHAIMTSGGYVTVARSIDYGDNWVYPTSTTGDVTPHLSVSNNNQYTDIATSASGQYVYAVWLKAYDIVQVARSIDYGDNWTAPSSTPQGAGTINLSGASADFSHVTTSSTGQYVYAIWDINIGGPTSSYIQALISSDYGDNWVDPTSTAGSAAGGFHLLSNLTSFGQGFSSTITTNSTGQYVYAIWHYDNTGTGDYYEQVSVSSDYGVNWVYPIATPGFGGTPTLSLGDITDTGEVTTSSSGQYVYACWTRYNNTDDIVEVAISSDYGDNWVYPTSTTGSGGTPGLSDSGQDGFANYGGSIIADSTGQYVYCIWERTSGGLNKTIQVALSIDYGDNWIDPTTVPSGDPLDIPNISPVDVASAYQHARIMTNTSGEASGRYIYTTWLTKNSSAKAQEANALNDDIQPPPPPPPPEPVVHFPINMRPARSKYD